MKSKKVMAIVMAVLMTSFVAIGCAPAEGPGELEEEDFEEETMEEDPFVEEEEDDF